MFRKVPEVRNQVQLTKSDVKDVRKGLLKAMPGLEPYIEDIMPKKAAMFGCRLKSNDKSELTIVDGQIICFTKGKQVIPSLWLLQRYPFTLPKFQVDKGAIRFILAGADIMCPGLTSAGGSMVDVESGTIVAVFAEGKEHPIGVGLTTNSTAEIRKVNKDIGVLNLHYVGDDLWKLDLSH